MKMYVSHTNVQRAKQKSLLENHVEHVYNDVTRTNYEKENHENYYGKKTSVKKSRSNKKIVHLLDRERKENDKTKRIHCFTKSLKVTV